jgi:hypothetical protein
MIAEKQDFLHNFSNAIGTQDVPLALNVLASEIADIIKNYPNTVAKAVINSGIKISTPISQKDLVSILVNNLDKNALLRQNIASLIAVNTNAIEMPEHLSIEGFQQGLESIKNIGKNTAEGSGAGPVGAIVSGVSSAIGSVFGFLKSSKDAKAQKEAMQLQIMQQLNQDKKGISTGAIIGFSLGAIALIGLIFVVAKRNG